MKKTLMLLVAMIGIMPLFAKGYAEYLAEAKNYEAQKKWVYVLGSYYDALGTDGDFESKKEAYEAYKKLSDAIEAGNPGLGTFSEFTLHDEWKKLLIDAEKYGSSICIHDIKLSLTKGDLDYATKTATYIAKAFTETKLDPWSETINENASQRYNATIEVIRRGYERAWREDWKDLPAASGNYGDVWPVISASSQHNTVYNVNGALVLAYPGKNPETRKPQVFYFNAFSTGFGEGVYPYDFALNIVDKNGKELVKPRRCLCGWPEGTKFTGITPAVMDLIEKGEAFLNPVACYLDYGLYNAMKGVENDRMIVGNFPEIQIPLSRCVISRWNGSSYDISDKTGENFRETMAVPERREQEKRLQEMARQVEQAEREKLENIREKLENIKENLTVKAKQIIEAGTVYNFPLMRQQAFLIPREKIYKATHDRDEAFWLHILCCIEQSKKLGLEPVYDIKIVKDENTLNYRFRWISDYSASGFRYPSKKELENIKLGLSYQINDSIYGECDNGTVTDFERDLYGYYCFIRSTKKTKK